MTKTDFISYLESIYYKVGTPEVKQPEDSSGVTWYSVNVVEKGSAENEDPAIYRKNISFYVVDEGEAEELAGFERRPKLPEVDQSVKTTSGSLADIDKIFRSSLIRSRVRSAVLTAAQAIFFEGDGVTNHAERKKWAMNAMKDPEPYTTQMMAIVCLQSDVQSAGTGIEDSVLQNDVNGWITNFAVEEFGA